MSSPHALAPHALSRVGLENFRRFETISVPLARRLLFVGPNGAGKTTLLEAVHLLGTTISFRTRRDADLVRGGALRARVLGLGEGLRREIVLGDERRHLRDGERVTRGELLGGLGVTPLLPGDLAILQGAPAERRRFLDLALAQASPGYGALLLRLRKIERQRRSAIVTGADARPWRRALIEAAPEILRARRDAVAALAPMIASYGERLYAGTRRLALRCLAIRIVGPAALEDPTPETVEGILARVAFAESRERRPGWSSDRWDLAVTLDGDPIARLGSQGELRAAAIALRLGSMRFLGAERGVLLVDDVWGELDSERREALQNALDETPAQVLLAAVEIGALQTKIQGLSCFPMDANSARIRP